jgi:aerobic carbon-monoxide dehydrogenase medium subunit
MRLPKFQYHEPRTLVEACEIMADLKDRARPLAGGTDLLVNMKKGIFRPESVVSLSGIQALNGMENSGTMLKVGACSTIAKLAASHLVFEKFTALHAGAGSLGSPLIRNLATAGGNLISARPAADLPPALMAYGASVILKSISGEKTIPLHDFFLGPGKTVMEADEILSKILLPDPPPGSGAAYIKLGNRKSLEISMVNVASFISLDPGAEKIQKIRIVLGAVAPIPLRAVSAEQLLTGEKPGGPLFRRAAKAAASECKPIDDFRGSARYRRAMVEVLVERSLETAWRRAAA